MTVAYTGLYDWIVGCQALYALGGTTVDAIVVGPETVSTTGGKPDIVPITNWTKLGTVTDLAVTPKNKYVPRRAPSPGKYQTRKQVLESSELEFSIALQEHSLLVQQILWNAKTVDLATGAYIPNSMTGAFEAWIKFQLYNEADTLINSADVWCQLDVGPAKFAEKVFDYALKLTLLKSSLNTGCFAGF